MSPGFSGKDLLGEPESEELRLGDAHYGRGLINRLTCEGSLRPALRSQKRHSWRSILSVRRDADEIGEIFEWPLAASDRPFCLLEKRG